MNQLQLLSGPQYTSLEDFTPGLVNGIVGQIGTGETLDIPRLYTIIIRSKYLDSDSGSMNPPSSQHTGASKITE
jgi:hypothetical protein